MPRAQKIMSACTDISVFMEYRVSAYRCVSAENAGVPGSTCPYISTKGMGMHGITPTDESKVKTYICVRTDAYDKYGRYKPVRDMGMDVVEKVRKGISYADALQQGS